MMTCDDDSYTGHHSHCCHYCHFLLIDFAVDWEAMLINFIDIHRLPLSIKLEQCVANFDWIR